MAGGGVVDLVVRRGLDFTELLAGDPLKDFFVWWDDISAADVKAFEKRLRTATREHDLQSFLESNAKLLIQHVRGGHGRYVIPQKRLGAEYVTDFIIGGKHSGGFEWQAVELESPKAPMFTKSGYPSKYLMRAIFQILDWRAWLQRNQNYAARLVTEGGLGLTDIVARVPGLILIGRRKEIDPSTNERRRQLVNELATEIHSYDFLLEWAKGRLRPKDTSQGTDGAVKNT